MEKTLYFNNSAERIEFRGDRIMTIAIPPTTEFPGDVLETLFKKMQIRNDLNAFLGPTKNLLVIVNDASRPTPTSRVLSLIYDQIKHLNIDFLIATGLHPAPTEPEMRRIFGDLYNKIKDSIKIHDPKSINDLSELGYSRNNTVLSVNKLVLKADKIITISSIEPHYFAGFTGGRKSILPGVAGYNTIEQNHRQSLHPNAKPLALKSNPVHEDMVDMIEAVGTDRFYTIQVVMDRQQRITHAGFGHIHEVFENTCVRTRSNFCVTMPNKVDILLSIASPPFDESFYQSLKAIENTKNILNESGIFILVSAGYKGIGPPHFSRLFENPDDLTAAAENALINYRLGDHAAVNLRALMTKADLWCVTNSKNYKLDNAGIKVFTSIQRSIDEAILKKGVNPKIAIVEDGCSTVPVLNDKEDVK